MNEATSGASSAAIQTDPAQMLRVALRDPSVPKVYGNQFFTFVGSHDVAIMFGVMGVPSAVLNLSYPLAKTLATSLTQAIADYEKAVNVQVTATDILDKALAKS